MKRPLAVGLLSLSLFQFSAQNAVAVGSYRNTTTTSADRAEMEAVMGWAAIAAGVAVVGAVVATVESAYNIGTIVGHAAYDMFGSSQQLAAANFERDAYVADDFSQFDHPGQI